METIYIISGIVVGFPLIWFGIIFLISRVGGWSSLANHYAYGDGHKANLRTGRSLSLIRLRFFPCNYSFVTTISLDDNAVYISVAKIFAFGHKPLRLPFRDLTVSRHGKSILSMGHIRAAKEPNIKIAMRAKDITWIESVCGGLTPHK